MWSNQVAAPGCGDAKWTPGGHADAAVVSSEPPRAGALHLCHALLLWARFLGMHSRHILGMYATSYLFDTHGSKSAHSFHNPAGHTR